MGSTGATPLAKTFSEEMWYSEAALLPVRVTRLSCVALQGEGLCWSYLKASVSVNSVLRQAFVSTERLAAVVLSLSIGVRLLRGPYVQARFKLPSAKYDKFCLQTHAFCTWVCPIQWIHLNGNSAGFEPKNMCSTCSRREDKDAWFSYEGTALTSHITLWILQLIVIFCFTGCSPGVETVVCLAGVHAEPQYKGSVWDRSNV